MTPNRPVNRVTSKRRPAGASTSGAAGTAASAEENAAATGKSGTVAGKSAAAAGKSGESAAPAGKSARPARPRPAPGARRTTPAPAEAGEAPEAAGEAPEAAGDATARATAATTGGGLRRFLPGGRPATAGSADPSRTETTDGGKGTAGRGWGVPIACLIAAALLAGFAVVAALRPGVPDGDRAFVDTAATEEVRAAADNALRTIYGYDIARIDGYPDAVRQVVTGAMLADLDKFAATTIDAIKQSQTSATATADPIGVTLLTEDRAELLVNLVVSATKDGAAQQSVAGPVVLRMTKVDGRWLASEIVDR